MERRVFRIDKAGSIGRLKKQTEAVAERSDNQVVVQVKAIGLNFADIFALQGLYSATPNESFIPGLEFAGEVLEGPMAKGTRVLGVTRFGAYTDHVVIDQEYLMQLPDGWDFADGAATPVQALTAYYALVPLGNLQQAQLVLIHSAAGGVGIWANRIAKALGARTIGTVGNGSKLPVLNREGYNHALVRSDKLYDDVLRLTSGEHPELVLECIGGKIFKESYRVLAKGGRIVPYGAAHFGNSSDRPNMLRSVYKYLTRPRLDPLTMMRENKSVMPFNLIWMFEKKALFARYMKEIMQLDLPRPFIGHRFDFDDFPDAVRRLQTGNTTGKVVVEVS